MVLHFLSVSQFNKLTNTSYTFTDNYDFLLFECGNYSRNWGNITITYSGKGTFVLLDHTFTQELVAEMIKTIMLG